MKYAQTTNQFGSILYMTSMKKKKCQHEMWCENWRFISLFFPLSLFFPSLSLSLSLSLLHTHTYISVIEEKLITMRCDATYWKRHSLANNNDTQKQIVYTESKEFQGIYNAMLIRKLSHHLSSLFRFSFSFDRTKNQKELVVFVYRLYLVCFY